jgi:ser/thr/tyr protein kinase RAD53
MPPQQVLNMTVKNRVIPNMLDADDAQEKLEDLDFIMSQTGATQSTQQASQQPEMEGHLWGYLQPCSTKLTRIDFWKVRPSYKIGRMDDDTVNDLVLPGMKISKLLITRLCSIL